MTEENCDCRRVIFEVISEKRRKPVAYVSFGRENEAFYAGWLGRNDMVTVKELQGPILNPGSPQSKLAPAILELTKNILQDQNYVARIKRHYKMFKETVDRKLEQPLNKAKISDISPVPVLPERKISNPENATALAPLITDHWILITEH